MTKSIVAEFGFEPQKKKNKKTKKTDVIAVTTVEITVSDHKFLGKI